MIRIGAAVTLLVGFAVTASALEIPLTYERYPLASSDFQPMGGATLKCRVGTPRGKWNLPELVSENPVYIAYELAGQQHMMVLDRQRKGGPFYNRIYFDANGNRDLTDDPVIDGTVHSHGPVSYRAQFDPCDVTLNVGSDALPFSFAVAARCFVRDPKRSTPTAEELAKHLRVEVTTNCRYTGTLDLDDKSLQIVLSDGNANGTFDDLATLPKVGWKNLERLLVPFGDHLYFKTAAKMNIYHSVPLGQYLSIGGRLFAASVDIPGGKIVLSEPEGALVSVELPMEVEHLALLSETSGTCVMLRKPPKQVTIPAGSYMPVKYRALRRDDQGDLWELLALAAGRTSTLDLSTDGATVTFGEPYTPTVIIEPTQVDQLKAGRIHDLPMVFCVRGQANEQLLEVMRIEGHHPLDGDRPKEAEYRIVETDGKAVAQGAFKYG
ncbi:MAG: hypothetical protein GY851_26175 [bacterium]|nr:hypothetical protein [bacterium]